MTPLPIFWLPVDNNTLWLKLTIAFNRSIHRVYEWGSLIVFLAFYITILISTFAPHHHDYHFPSQFKSDYHSMKSEYMYGLVLQFDVLGLKRSQDTIVTSRTTSEKSKATTLMLSLLTWNECTVQQQEYLSSIHGMYVYIADEEMLMLCKISAQLAKPQMSA